MNTSNSKISPADLNASTVLMVSNISRNVTKKHLNEIFSPYGELKGIYVPRNEDTKIQKSYVFLEFANRDNAEKAMLYFSGGQIDGTVVKVEMLNPQNINSINSNVNEINKFKENNMANSNRIYRDKVRDNQNFSEYHNKNEIHDDVHNLDDNIDNLNMKKVTPFSADNNFNKSNFKRLRSRSRSRKRSRSNSHPRYRRDNNYKNSRNYNNYNPYGGNRRNQDFNERDRKKFRRRNSRSIPKSYGRSSSRSSNSST